MHGYSVVAIIVREIMNPEVLTLEPGITAKHALRELLAANVSGAPVVDPERHPLGVLSIRDLVTHREAFVVEECMHKPALAIEEGAPIEEAARLLAETGFHRLVVVDEHQHTVGVLTPADVLRGMLGLPAQWPPTFAHLDRETGLVWSAPLPLHLDRVEAAPDGPGVFLLIFGRAGDPEQIVWAEAAPNVRERLIRLLVAPDEAPAALRADLDARTIRFRAAATEQPDAQRRALDAVQRREHTRE